MDRDENQYLPANKLLWDCGSSLYDSFELKSFKRQLDAAIATRCFSMPHFSQPPPTAKKKHSSKLYRALQKLVMSVFRLRSTSGRSSASRRRADDHIVFGSSRANSDFGFLASIPEVCEKDLSSPELAPTVVRKTVSERFIGTTVKLEKMY